jgi:hypothetical protein
MRETMLTESDPVGPLPSTPGRVVFVDRLEARMLSFSSRSLQATHVGARAEGPILTEIVTWPINLHRIHYIHSMSTKHGFL